MTTLKRLKAKPNAVTYTCPLCATVKVVTNKRCPKCAKVKPIADFYRDRKRIDGHQSVCKECGKVMVLNWRANNREHFREVANAGNRRRRAGVYIQDRG